MAEMVSKAVAQETVSKTLAGLVDKYVEKSNGKEHMERLEMAHIKLEAALEISNKWQITDASLLRWRKKLKRAAQECDDTVHKCKQRILEKEDMEHGVRSSSFPRRIAHFTKSFISSLFSHDNAEARSLLQRFEWYAHGATEFLRFVELGGTPHRYMFFDPLVRHLLAGKKMQHKIFRGNQYYLLSLMPYTAVDGGIEGRLVVFHKDCSAPETNFCFALVLQLSDSTDIVGIILRCLQLFTPHFKSTAEVASKELSQLAMQQYSWVPNANSSHNEVHWDNIHSVFTQWLRPNSLCCKQHRRGLCTSNTSASSRLIDTSPEPVILVYLERHILLSDYKRHLRTSDVEGERNSMGDPQSPYARLGLAFSPHSSSEELLPAVESSAIELINGEVQHYSHTNVSLEQVDEIMLPKGIDRLRQKAEATKYQILWKSRHGAAFLVVEKAGMPHVPSTRRSTRKGKLWHRVGDPDLESTHRTADFLNLWFPYTPGRLQSSIAGWVQKVNGNPTSKTSWHLV